jgi:hypothetical protein
MGELSQVALEIWKLDLGNECRSEKVEKNLIPLN